MKFKADLISNHEPSEQHFPFSGALMIFHHHHHQKQKRSLFFFLRLSFLLAALCSLLACAPSLYSVNLKYDPPKGAIPAMGTGQKFIITVATFHDARPGSDDLRIGRVITQTGNLSTVIPKNMKPAVAVSTMTKEMLVASGYQVSVARPSWDLQEDAIKKDWGQIVVGGSIEEFEIVCRDNIVVKKYDSRVKLNFVFADAQHKRIIYRTTTASENSLEHVQFSEEMLGKQISEALSDAIAQAFAGNTRQKITEALKQP
jgi:hypothetical protein